MRTECTSSTNRPEVGKVYEVVAHSTSGLPDALFSGAWVRVTEVRFVGEDEVFIWAMILRYPGYPKGCYTLLRNPVLRPLPESE